MATWKYWKDENYVREYEDGKMEDLNQSQKKHGISMGKKSCRFVLTELG